MTLSSVPPTARSVSAVHKAPSGLRQKPRAPQFAFGLRCRQLQNHGPTTMSLGVPVDAVMSLGMMNPGRASLRAMMPRNAIPSAVCAIEWDIASASSTEDIVSKQKAASAQDLNTWYEEGSWIFEASVRSEGGLQSARSEGTGKATSAEAETAAVVGSSRSVDDAGDVQDERHDNDPYLEIHEGDSAPSVLQEADHGAPEASAETGTGHGSSTSASPLTSRSPGLDSPPDKREPWDRARVYTTPKMKGSKHH